MHRRLIIAVGLVLCMPAARSFGHGVAIYVATPASPPAGLEWVAYGSAAVLFLLNVVLLRALRLTGWLTAVLAPLLAIGIPAHAFITYGDMAANRSTAPDPGLAWAGRPFLGMKWKLIGDLFVEWNGVGLWLLLLGIGSLLYLSRFDRSRWPRVLMWTVVLLLLGWWLTPYFLGRAPWAWLIALTTVLACAVFWDQRRLFISWRFWAVLLANAMLYAICLSPFFARGIYAAGWTGNHVRRRCESQVARLAYALVRHMEQHDGRLPQGQTMEEVFPQIEPYIDDHKTSFGQPIHICPTEYLYERRPRAYRWHPKLSGLAMSALQMPQSWDEHVLSCPHHDLAPELPLLNAFDLRDGRECPLVKWYLKRRRDRQGPP
ncbi:hypothetical protein HQ576_01045 [bacterium]|nr:hypothetical protein [bacterium]